MAPVPARTFFYSGSSSYFHNADELISRGALIVIGQE